MTSIKIQHQFRRTGIDKFLLWCGILSSIYYTALNIYIPSKSPDYSTVSQTVSELSAISAPTKLLWTWLCIPYTILGAAFAIGVWRAGSDNRYLRMTGGIMITYSVVGMLWPFAPMHMREVLAGGGSTISDSMHIALGIVTEILFLCALIFAAKAFGKKFRVYSVVTLILLLLFGILTFLEAPDIARNRPTPLIGVWERINIGLFLLWIIVLALLLMKKTGEKGLTATSRQKAYSASSLS